MHGACPTPSLGPRLTAPCCSSRDALPRFAPVKLVCHFPAQALSLEDLPAFISIGLTYHHPGRSKAMRRVTDFGAVFFQTVCKSITRDRFQGSLSGSRQLNCSCQSCPFIAVLCSLSLSHFLIHLKKKKQNPHCPPHPMLTKRLKMDVGAEPCQGLFRKSKILFPCVSFSAHLLPNRDVISSISYTKMMTLFSQDLSSPLVGVRRSLLFISEIPSCPEQK